MTGSVIRIAERVWSAWREQLEDGFEPFLQLVLTSSSGSEHTTRALRESIFELQAGGEPQAGGACEPLFPGEWGWMRVPEGVLVAVGAADDFEGALSAVARGLERRGVNGTFDLAPEPPTATLNATAHMLECRVRVRGERVRRDARNYRWRPDPDAHEALLAAAERWCRTHGSSSMQWLSTATVADVAVQPDEPVLDRLMEEVGDNMYIRLSAVTADEFRAVAAHAWAGGVSLVVGGASIERGRWQPALAELTGLLRDHAGLLAYGHVRRGWAVFNALGDRKLPYDWPRRRESQPRGPGGTPEAFEDVYAPDAFGVQLLGPGYAGRIPDTPHWRQTHLAGGSVLLERVDPSAWFDAPFVPYDEPTEFPAPPPVLAAAREELAPIIYERGVLSHNRYVPADEPL